MRQSMLAAAVAVTALLLQGCVSTQEQTTTAQASTPIVDAVTSASPVPSAPTAAQEQLMGYTNGAQILSGVEVKWPALDARSGVIYHQVATPRSLVQLKMHLLIPQTNEPKPALIFFPGGGFTSADLDRYSQMRFALAERGFVVATAEYRVVPNKYPSLVEDGKAAVRYLRAHAQDLGIDPTRIGVFGDSAGGYLTQMVATTNGETKYDQGDFTEVSSEVQAACSIYGISDLSRIGEGYSDEIVAVHQSPAVTEALLLHGPAFNTFPGATIDSDPALTQEASAINHVDAKDPPMLLLHGSADTLVSPWQSAQMYQKLKDAGVDARYVVVEGAAHGGVLWQQAPVINTVANFFVEKLGPVGTTAESH